MAHMHRPDLECCAPLAPPGQMMIPTSPEAPAQARKWVRELLGHEDPPLKPDRLDDVCLVVSELVTNAYRYGTEPGDSMLIAVLPTLDRVRIEVHDPVRRRPYLRNASGERARGRGLHIVDALAIRWDVDDRPFGKTVWAEVAR